MNPTETLSYFDGRREAMIEAIREIVDIESPSYNVEQSKLVVDRIVEMAREVSADLRIARVPADKYGEHLIIRAFPSDDKSTLLIGHTDTVHPIGTNEKNPTRIEDD